MFLCVCISVFVFAGYTDAPEVNLFASDSVYVSFTIHILVGRSHTLSAFESSVTHIDSLQQSSPEVPTVLEPRATSSSFTSLNNWFYP